MHTESICSTEGLDGWASRPTWSANMVANLSPKVGHLVAFLRWSEPEKQKARPANRFSFLTTQLALSSGNGARCSECLDYTVGMQRSDFSWITADESVLDSYRFGLSQCLRCTTTFVKTLRSPDTFLMRGGQPCMLRIRSDSGGNTNEIDHSVSHGSRDSDVRRRDLVSRARRRADRPGQGGGVHWQEDRDEGQGRGRLPPVFRGGETVRGHHGRPEEYRRAPFRVRLLRCRSR